MYPELLALWIRQAKGQGRTHVLVVEDTSIETAPCTFPVFVRRGDSVERQVARLNGTERTRVLNIVEVA